MTTDELRKEAEWAKAYIAHEWHGSAKYSRLARVLPAVLDTFLALTAPPCDRCRNTGMTTDSTVGDGYCLSVSLTQCPECGRKSPS